MWKGSRVQWEKEVGRKGDERKEAKREREDGSLEILIVFAQI